MERDFGIVEEAVRRGDWAFAGEVWIVDARIAAVRSDPSDLCARHDRNKRARLSRNEEFECNLIIVMVGLKGRFLQRTGAIEKKGRERKLRVRRLNKGSTSVEDSI